MKITRRTQLLVVALALCFTTMIGSTFAWFTDSVSVTGNKIESGTLKLEVLYQDGNEWKDLETKEDPLFNYNKWEPGYAVVKGIEIKNIGTLALKYKVNFELTAESSDDYKLEDVIDVYLFSQIPADRSAFANATPVGTLADLIYTEDVDGTVHGKLAGNATTGQLYIGLKMQETANNNYQGLTVGDGFNLVIVATQDTVELDSFGNDYDAGAPFPGDPVVVSTAEELLAELAKDGDKNINATGLEVDFPDIATAKDNRLVRDLAGGTTISGLTVNITGAKQTFFTNVSGEIVFNNCTFKSGDFSHQAYFQSGPDANQTKLVFNNCIFEGPAIFADNTGGGVEFNNCSFNLNSDKYGYVQCMGGNHTMNQCTFNYSDANSFFDSPMTKHGKLNTYSDRYNTVVNLNNCTSVSDNRYNVSGGTGTVNKNN